MLKKIILAFVKNTPKSTREAYKRKFPYVYTKLAGYANSKKTISKASQNLASLLAPAEQSHGVQEKWLAYYNSSNGKLDLQHMFANAEGSNDWASLSLFLDEMSYQDVISPTTFQCANTLCNYKLAKTEYDWADFIFFIVKNFDTEQPQQSIFDSETPQLEHNIIAGQLVNFFKYCDPNEVTDFAVNLAKANRLSPRHLMILAICILKVGSNNAFANLVNQLHLLPEHYEDKSTLKCLRAKSFSLTSMHEEALTEALEIYGDGLLTTRSLVHFIAIESLKSTNDTLIYKSIEAIENWQCSNENNNDFNLIIAKLHGTNKGLKQRFEKFANARIDNTNDQTVLLQFCQTYLLYEDYDNSLDILRHIFHKGLAGLVTQLHYSGILAAKNEPKKAIMFLTGTPPSISSDIRKKFVIGHILAWSNNKSASKYLKDVLTVLPNDPNVLADLAFVSDLNRRYVDCLNLMLASKKSFVIGNAPLVKNVKGLHIMTLTRLNRRIIFAAQCAGQKDLALSLQNEYRYTTRLRLPYDFVEWSSEEIQNKKIVVLSELGIGDEIRYTSVFGKYLKDAKTVIFTCDPRLKTLMERTFPKFEIHPVAREFVGSQNLKNGRRDQTVNNSMKQIMTNEVLERGKDFDLWVRAINLFERDQIEYNCLDNSEFEVLLKPDQKKLGKYKKIFGALRKGKKIIGLSWRGARQTYSRSPHYFDLEEWTELLINENYLFVNLQYDCDGRELELLSSLCGDRLVSLNGIDLQNDFEELAAICANLDFVISVCTAVLELAAGVGTKVVYMMNSPQITHVIRLASAPNKNGFYQDSVWKNCMILPRFSLTEKEMVSKAMTHVNSEMRIENGQSKC